MTAVGIISSSYARTTTAASYADEVLADSPYAWYRLKDASGNPVDSSGNSRDATGVNSSPTYHTTGGPVTDGGYMSFDGIDDYVSLGNIDSWMANQADFTVEFYYRSTDTSNAAIMGSFNNDAKTGHHIKLNRNGNDTTTSSGALSSYLRDDGNDRLTTNTSSGFTTGAWAHIAVVVESGSSNTTVYKNGSPVTDYDLGGSISTSELSAWQYAYTLGARNLRGTISDHCATDLAEVAFYQAPLSSTRILAHFDAS